MEEARAYTTQLQAGLGMVPETIILLKLWQPGDSAKSLSEKAVREGVFSRNTARRSVNIVKEMFAPRYLVDNGKPARALKQLVEASVAPDDLTQLFFLYTARAQAIFAEFILDVYWRRYAGGSTRLTTQEAQSFIHQALNTGRMQKRWTDSTIRRVSAYLLGCCVDFGLLRDFGRAERQIARFSVRPAVANYLAHELHFAGLNDFAITRHPDWRLFGLEPHEVINELRSVANDGHFIIQASPELVDITWKYKTMEDAIRAIAQR